MKRPEVGGLHIKAKLVTHSKNVFLSFMYPLYVPEYDI